MIADNTEVNSIFFVSKASQTTFSDMMRDYQIVSYYLTLDLTLEKERITPQNSSYGHQIQPSKDKEISGNGEILKQPPSKKHKSSCHNFQKHLITSLKKFINISKRKLIEEPSGLLSFMIWERFLGCNIMNKKILYLVFGAQEEIININKSPSKQQGWFQEFLQRYPYSQVLEAQRLLREKIVVQARTLSKSFVKANTNISNFDEFYLYLRTFIIELENGPLTRQRILTTRKKLVIEKQQ